MSTRTIKVPSVLYRMGTSEKKESGEMELSISSDTPYRRYDWMNDEEYLEVLDHEQGMDAERLMAGAALLFNHDRNIQLGTISAPEMRDGKCYVTAKLSAAADVASYRTRIEEGILKDTSVGYSITDAGTQIGTRDGLPIYKFKWAPHEASMVTIPADITVGVGRAREEEGKSELREITVDNILNAPKQSTQPNQSTMTTPAAPTTPTVTIDPTSERNAAVAEFKQRCAKIDSYVSGLKHPQWKQAATEIAGRHKTGEADFDAFRTEALDAFEGVTRIAAEDKGIGMTARDLGEYSLVRAINNLTLGVKTGQRINCLEFEVSDEVAKSSGRATQGLYIPHDVMTHKRALTTNVFSAAGALVETGPQGQSLIELLRNQMYVVAMGARVISGLKGNLAIPSQTGGATAAWLSEDATITASQQTVGQVSLTPHRLAAATAFTFQLLAQSTPDVESFVREDLMKVLAIAKDLAALSGSGVSGQPLGIAALPGKSTSVTLAGANSMTYANAVQFETNVATANALNGSLGYLTSVATKGNSKLVAEIAAANSIPVWKNDMVNGYKALATNQLTTLPSVIYGNWNDLIIADWGAGGNEVIVDPYSLSMQGQVRIVIQHLTDTAVRHAKSFSISTT
jgi:HK97 family phage major capsid protein